MTAVIEISHSEQSALIGNFNGENVKLRRITVKEYDAMIEGGVFNEDDQIELLSGVIIEKIPKGTKHSAATDRASRVFNRLFGEEVFIRNQNPVWLDDFSEPEPDIVLAKPPRENYLENHPTASDIYLIIEISDTTLVYDRDTKAKAYSRGRIEQYILLNLQNETVEAYREPGEDGYQFKRTLRKGDSLNLAAFPEVEIKIDDLF